MKKILIVFFSVLILFSITGCGNKNNDESSSNINSNLYNISLNVQGMGQVAFAKEGESLVFDSDYPVQSIQTEEEKFVHLTIGAKANEGYHFVKWIKNGEDFSTDEQIDIEITENIDLIAVFE